MGACGRAVQLAGELEGLLGVTKPRADGTGGGVGGEHLQRDHGAALLSGPVFGSLHEAACDAGAVPVEAFGVLPAGVRASLRVVGLVHVTGFDVPGTAGGL